MKQKEKIIKAIKTIASKLNRQNITWLVGGSGSLLVHGLAVIPNDIDVVVNPENYDDVKTILNDVLVGITKIDGETIKTPFKICDVSGELLAHHIDRNLLTTVNIEDVSISVYQLQVEYGFYKSRTDKVEANKKKIELIEKALLNKA